MNFLAAELFHDGFLLLGPESSMQKANSERGKELLQPFVLFRDSFDIASRAGVLNSWIYHVGLPPFGDLLSYELPDFWKLLRRSQKSLYHAALPRKFIDHGNIQVAIKGESEGARDRSGGH